MTPYSFSLGTLFIHPSTSPEAGNGPDELVGFHLVLGSGMLINAYQPALWQGELWFIAFASFCGVNIPIMAHFKLSTSCLWTQSREMCPNHSCELVQVDFCTPLARILGPLLNPTRASMNDGKEKLKTMGESALPISTTKKLSRSAYPEWRARGITFKLWGMKGANLANLWASPSAKHTIGWSSYYYYPHYTDEATEA